MREADRLFTGQEFNKFLQMKLIYAWYRKDVCLYVGKTERGIGRFVGHHIIGKVNPVEDSDEFKFWFCETTEELDQLEVNLIVSLKPVLNYGQHKKFLPSQSCAKCGDVFRPKSRRQTCCYKCIKRKQVKIAQFVEKKHRRPNISEFV